MKHLLPASSKWLPNLTGLVVLALAAVHLAPDLDAQDSQPSPDRDPSPRADAPGTAPSPPRSRMLRLPTGGAPLRGPTEVVPARFEATVYELRLPEARVADFEAPALEARAATTAELAKALAEFGETKVLYKIDQTVNLCGESITIGSREPMVTGTRQMGPGGAVNSVTYQEVGLIVNLATSPAAADAPRPNAPVQVNFELSALTDSDVEIAHAVRAQRVRNLQLSHSETPRFGKPVVVLNASATPGADEAPLTAYVVRYVFRQVAP